MTAPAATTHRHAFGETSGCCDACTQDGWFESDEGERVICREACPDPSEPAHCAHCGHTIEAVA